MTKKPRIGVTPCSRVEDYVESVKRAGADPVVLSNDEDPAAVLERVDGVLLTGGLDVDPALYNEAAHPTTETAPERDRFEIPLTKEAILRDVPLFAICRGVQVLNVAAGGTLIQDIPSEVRTGLPHSIDVPKNHIAHDVAIAPGSRLEAVMADTLKNGPTCPVNSRHHQAVGKVAPDFVVSASSPDGIVEAIEKPDAAFCVGVQWHPENFWKTGEFAPLFEAFVTAAASQHAQTAAGHKDHEAHKDHND